MSALKPASPIPPTSVRRKSSAPISCAVGVEPLAKDLEALKRPRDRLDGGPDHEVFIRVRVVGHVGIGAEPGGIAGRADHADAEVVRAELGGGGAVEALAVDLVLTVRRAGVEILAPPDHHVLVVDGVPRHRRAIGLGDGIAGPAGVADAEVVGAQLGTGRGVEALAVDFELVVHSAAPAVVARPDHQKLAAHRVVGHCGVVGVEVGVVGIVTCRSCG